MSRVLADPDDLAGAQASFARFAEIFADLGLYAAICRGLAQDESAALMLAARPGQRRPVIVLAALHDLVLARPGVAAARWFPSVVGRDRTGEGDPWPDVRASLVEHADHLRSVIAERATQTNEVRRAVYVGALLAAACADVPDRPVALVEIGASAGLLLGVDRYRVEVHSAHGPHVWGDPSAPVVVRGELRGDPGRLVVAGAERAVDDGAGGLDGGRVGIPDLPSITTRVGIDLSPVALDDARELRWLQACIWPDVPGRVERFRSAVDLLRGRPPTMVQGDAVEALPEVLADLDPAAHAVVLSSWAVTYVERSRRDDLTAALAARAEAGAAALSWISAEPAGGVPGVVAPEGCDAGATVLGVRRWRGGRELAPWTLGTAHPHGEWVEIG